MRCLIAVVGPTAVGKSQFALRLAREFNCEIINADSRQVYQYMDIGTAKPSRTERSLVPHHIIDIINPDQSFSLAVYQKLANASIADIHQRNRIPMLVGGSGLYVWTVVEGWKLPEVPPDAQFRRQLEEKAKEEGAYVLYQELRAVDPVAATSIMPTNLRRIIRALEIFRTTGNPPSQLWKKEPPSYPILLLGLTTDRNDLYHRIDQRVEDMIKNGLVTETKDLIARGYGLDLPSMSGIGYRQIGMFLQGNLELLEAIRAIKFQTHRLARHQYAWFRLNDPRIHWLDVRDDLQTIPQRFLNDFLPNIENK